MIRIEEYSDDYKKGMLDAYNKILTMDEYCSKVNCLACSFSESGDCTREYTKMLRDNLINPISEEDKKRNRETMEKVMKEIESDPDFKEWKESRNRAFVLDKDKADEFFNTKGHSAKEAIDRFENRKKKND